MLPRLARRNIFSCTSYSHEGGSIVNNLSHRYRWGWWARVIAEGVVFPPTACGEGGKGPGGWPARGRSGSTGSGMVKNA